jgi:formylglycine-generating enzyme required for sulfatase activity
VASHPGDVSPYGVLDMAGNVNEWTSTPSRERDGYFIQKGGYFGLVADGLRLAYADGSDQNARDTKSVYTGFRCAKDP